MIIGLTGGIGSGKSLALSYFQKLKIDSISADLTVKKVIDEDECARSTESYESSQQVSVPSDSSQCPQCNAVFANMNNMLRHVKIKHEGVKYPCNQCDYKATQTNHLRRYIKSKHEC